MPYTTLKCNVQVRFAPNPAALVAVAGDDCLKNP